MPTLAAAGDDALLHALFVMNPGMDGAVLDFTATTGGDLRGNILRPVRRILGSFGHFLRTPGLDAADYVH